MCVFVYFVGSNTKKSHALRIMCFKNNLIPKIAQLQTNHLSDCIKLNLVQILCMTFFPTTISILVAAKFLDHSNIYTVLQNSWVGFHDTLPLATERQIYDFSKTNYPSLLAKN
jgi:hypothetical protein